MSMSQLRTGGLLLAACLALWGCPDGESRFIPPQASAAPGSTSRVFVYVAEGRDPSLSEDVATEGGAVSAYQLGQDGFLPGGAPISVVRLVNPRRLAVHPAIPVLYVGTRNQVVAFDISEGSLRSLCPEGGELSPPCATNPRGRNRPVDMTVAAADDGTFTLYVAETGQAAGTDDPSRIAAYPLGENGELPGFAGSQGTTARVNQFEGVAVDSLFTWGADTSSQRVYRFDREADGSLPQPAPTPAPINFPTPTPSPTPSEGDPTPSPTPMVRYFGVNFPGRIQVIEYPNPTPEGNVGVLYAVEQGSQRLGAWKIDEFYDLPGFPNSESPIQGLYNSILIAPDRSRIYGALFQDGSVSSYALDADGDIIDSSESLTFSDPASNPTGLAWLEYTPPGGSPEKTVFVSLGGLGRVDGYRVGQDGGLASRPFTSTQPRFGTFPTDIAINVLSVR